MVSSPGTQSLFESEGVLPPEAGLPRFSLIEHKMGMPYRDWFNSLLARVDYYRSGRAEQGMAPTIKDFCSHPELIGPENKYSSMRRLVSIVLEVSGVEVKKSGIPPFGQRLLTDAGAVMAAYKWSRYHRYGKNTVDNATTKEAI